MKKREELKVTEHPTPLTTSFDEFKAMLPECQHGDKVGYCEECKKEMRSVTVPQWREDERIEKEKEREERARELREHPEREMKGYIPNKFLDRSLETFTGSESIVKLCDEYVAGFVRKKTCVEGVPLCDEGFAKHSGSILFIGKTGCGKTHLAVAILRELVKRGALYDFKFITAPELLLEIRATFRPAARKYDDGGRCEADTEQDVLDKYSKCEFLILDDLGAEKVSDFTIQSLYLVIDRRNRNLKPTIVTTNLSLEEIETLIDARMASRLADMKVVKLTMPDYRKKR